LFCLQVPAPSLCSIHEVFLPVQVSSSTLPPTPPAASRHGKSAAPNHPGEPCLDDFAQIARHERDHPDAAGPNHRLHGTRDRSANERIHTQFSQALPLSRPRIRRQKSLGFTHDLPPSGLHNVDLSGHIEHRGNAIIPNGKSCFHASGPRLSGLESQM